MWCKTNFAIDCNWYQINVCDIAKTLESRGKAILIITVGTHVKLALSSSNFRLYSSHAKKILTPAVNYKSDQKQCIFIFNCIILAV